MADGGTRRGDLYWLDAEATGGSSEGAPHPHLVVQSDLFNASRITTTVVCALTTNLTRAKEPGNVLLLPGEGGLPRRSVVVASQIVSVQKTHLGTRIGSLSDERVEEVLSGLAFLQRSFFTRRAEAPRGEDS